MNPIINGWFGMLGGVLSGALLGLCFHDESWLGGYGTWRRRMIRLGHISFFGIGFLNFVLGLTAPLLQIDASCYRIAVIAMTVAAIGMPACCFLSAWRKPFRHLFPIPVTGALIAISSILLGARPV
jgi:Kef-type K+ transport system membrane component KefB